LATNTSAADNQPSGDPASSTFLISCFCNQVLPANLQALIVQDDVGQELYSHNQVSVVLDESHSPELVHEVSDTRPRCSYHFRLGSRDSMWGIVASGTTSYSRRRALQENPGQPLFTVVEKLIAEIFFQPGRLHQKSGEPPALQERLPFLQPRAR
jgi:hypothetical protein